MNATAPSSAKRLPHGCPYERMTCAYRLPMMKLQEDVLEVQIFHAHGRAVLATNFFQHGGRGVAHAHERFVALDERAQRAGNGERSRQRRRRRHVKTLERVL